MSWLRRAWRSRGLWAVLAIFGGVLALRLALMRGYAQLLDCTGCLAVPALWSEAQLLAALVLADLAARRWLARHGWLVRCLVLACLLVVVVDFWVLDNFLQRLDWQQAAKFMREWRAGRAWLTQTAGGLPVWQLAAWLLGAALLAAALVSYVRRAAPRPPAWLVAGCAAALVAVTALQPPRSFHHGYVRNALEAFFDPPSLHRAYAPAWLAANSGRIDRADALCTPAPAALAQTPPLAAPRQVVLVVVESLSSYQSQAFGGIHDWTPQLDAWARRGRAFSHFLANGVTTEQGLYALLTGRPPLPQPGRASVYDSEQRTPQPSAAQLAERAGLASVFMTTGNLAFMDKGAWLKRIGFGELHGHDHPFYDGMQRYLFDAPRDDALYEHARAWMEQRRGQDYFLVLETVSSHQPYFDPIAQRPSIEGTFRYTDAALGRFLQQLERGGLLQQALVIVTGDHRAMVPTDAREWEQFGEDTMAAVPFVLLGRGVQPGWEHAYHSHQDLLPSLSLLLSGQAPCLRPGQGLWSPGGASAPAQCIFTNRPQYLDREFLRCGDQTLQLTLDAEDSRYVGPAGAPLWLDVLHAQRAVAAPAQ